MYLFKLYTGEVQLRYVDEYWQAFIAIYIDINMKIVIKIEKQK